ncbi:hypothetical protein [Listeria seeligeri]|nr:hypothetical protein [Listeria seeligeri]MBC1746892.1 hypothetical protein [Listeria seeligeri]MBC2233031.1 hypothetical protein [Listeria seeligeri]MBF2626139.1 hypothetical protein [Listeria seeligeri]MBF2673467.1 hypothetical protein [Listeria seeligeri]
MINNKEELNFTDRVIIAAATFTTEEFAEKDDDLEEFMCKEVANFKKAIEKGENLAIATGIVDEPEGVLDTFIDIKNKSVIQVISLFEYKDDITLTLFQAETEAELLREIQYFTFEQLAMADEYEVKEKLDAREVLVKRII